MDVEQAKRILGITDEDNGASAKVKFRKLIARYHPDVTGSDSHEYQEMAQLINAAYSLLKSEDFFLTRTVSEVLWKELINESVFTSRKGNYLRHAKAELEFLIRLAKEADQYKNPDMNQRIEKILADYKIQIRKIG